MLNALPLTPNGKVDRKKLPAPEVIARDSTRPLATSDDPIAVELTALWRKVIEVERIGIQDDFFDLGGHSLLALRLIAEIERSFGVPLPITSLLQEPTIEQLIPLLRRRHRSAAVSRRPVLSGAGRALFCVRHAVSLAPCFGTDLPTYELVTDPDDVFAHGSIKSLAASYVKKVRKVQRHGPYCLIGHSTSGIVAYRQGGDLRHRPAPPGQHGGGVCAVLQSDVDTLWGEDYRA